MYLAGTFWSKSPMEEAARWTIEEVLPIIKKTYPDIHFYIIGQGSDKILSDIKDENITVTGKLKSVLPYLCNSDVSLVPLMFESGTRFKILEAAACGIPIVSTVLGAEGINITNGQNILIADESQEFADAVLKILSDKAFAEELALNCKKFIQKNYSIEKLVNEAEEIIEYLTHTIS
jgi:glycosyltransferase involved in cell wall biosynthesis